MTSSIDIYLCLGYLLAWIITFIWYHIKRFALDAGSVIIGMQIIYAIFSVLTLTDELFSMAFEELHFFPYLYLYSMMMIAIGPIIYDHIHPTFKIAQPHTRILSILSIIIIATALIQIPDIVHNASTGVLALLTDTDAGKNAYDEQVEAVAESGKAIRNLPAIIYNALSDLIPFILFYFFFGSLRPLCLWLSFFEKQPDKIICIDRHENADICRSCNQNRKPVINVVGIYVDASECTFHDKNGQSRNRE